MLQTPIALQDAQGYLLPRSANFLHIYSEQLQKSTSKDSAPTRLKSFLLLMGCVDKSRNASRVTGTKDQIYIYI